MKNLKQIVYSNGYSLFILKNYDKASGVCHQLGITIHSVVDNINARAMHENGQLHYIFGIGNRKELSGAPLNRRMKLKNFKIK